ncbi:MAG TPA: hypothetical protein VFE05_23265 [Longimicrobiaceae bacterium]|nr:hypothetical protein [Longimicrobiaceae bacterium]
MPGVIAPKSRSDDVPKANTVLMVAVDWIEPVTCAEARVGAASRAAPNTAVRASFFICVLLGRAVVLLERAGGFRTASTLPGVEATSAGMG